MASCVPRFHDCIEMQMKACMIEKYKTACVPSGHCRDMHVNRLTRQQSPYNCGWPPSHYEINTDSNQQNTVAVLTPMIPSSTLHTHHLDRFFWYRGCRNLSSNSMIAPKSALCLMHLPIAWFSALHA